MFKLINSTIFIYFLISLSSSNAYYISDAERIVLNTPQSRTAYYQELANYYAGQIEIFPVLGELLDVVPYLQDHYPEIADAEGYELTTNQFMVQMIRTSVRIIIDSPYYSADNDYLFFLVEELDLVIRNYI